MGRENLPKGGALLICNHFSYVDAVILYLALFPRPPRFIYTVDLKTLGWIDWLLGKVSGIPVDPRRVRETIRMAEARISNGELVCIFPEGQISRVGAMIELKRGFELIARKAQAPIIPVYIDSLWGSVFSYKGGKYFWKLPLAIPYPLTVNIGAPLESDRPDPSAPRQSMLDLSAQAFEQRAELREHLGWACFRALAKAPFRVAVIEQYPERRALKAGPLLAVASLLAERWREQIPERRVGIALPTGLGAVVANLALTLAGKIPVNLNFTSGRAALEASLRRGEVRSVISAESFKAKVPDFPWPERFVDIKLEIGGLSKGRILRRLAAILLLPSGMMARRLGVPREGGEKEAALLFTSGSSGEPKGVVLSHRNVIGNALQIRETGILPTSEMMLACLPIFHSFGFTVTLWFPLLHGCRVTTFPTPLETRKLAEIIEAEKVTVLLGTATFLRPYLKKAEPKQLASVKFAIAGAEKLPRDLYEAYLDRFNVSIHEGYGLTETSPVVSVNVPGPARSAPGEKPQSGSRLGSVGRLLPGITARIADPDTGEIKSLYETGILWLKGANIFGGYLGDEQRTREMFRDGWLVTGDLARFDEDGFLYIEGRLSRFSKIGGEMVPHGTVEQKLVEVFSLQESESQPIVIVGTPDEAKGETLVAVSTVDLPMDAVRSRLTEAGLPNLWIPRKVVKVDKIPTLGSGKLDLKHCERLARGEG
jgi:acyl-[acyl-carrier-protein]-phospholipid O-acyltransferase / long-chain-fatty-acid--[acyl-carrier-protein] ligase